MPSLLGYSVCIEVDDAALPEFQINVDESARVATCWIPSEVGKEFAVVLTSRRNECETLSEVSMDGICVNRPICHRNVPRKVIKEVISRENGVFCARSFRFSSVTFTEDDNYEDRDTSEALGEISVQMTRIHKGDRYSVSNGPNIPLLKPNILHEKSKKTAAHCVSLGEAKTKTSWNKWKTKNYDPADPQPFVKFIFKYRPAAFLQANEIMPQPPRPPKRKTAECGSEGQGSDTESNPTQQETLNFQLPGARNSIPKNSSKAKKVKQEQQIGTDIKSEDSDSLPLLKRVKHSDANADVVLALIGDLAAAARTKVREVKGNWGLAVDSVTGMEKVIKEKLTLRGKEKPFEKSFIDEILTLVGDIAATGRSAVRQAKGDWGLDVDGISGLEKEIRRRVANFEEEDVIDLT